jgi:glycosyltransferase involved in cell wall biosynthesis
LSTQISKQIILVYLGKRGGGSRLLVDIANQLAKTAQVGIICSYDCEDLEDLEFTGQINKIHVPHNFVEVLRLTIFFSRIISLLKLILVADKVVFVMPHFLDYILLIFAKIFNVKSVYLVHDAKEHSGEKWPTSNAIKRRIKLVSSVVVFSQFVETEVSKLTTKKITVHELRHYPSTVFQRPKELIFSDYTLVIGRIVEYKGVEDVVKAWGSLDFAEKLVIAGHGKIEKVELPNVQVINRWLTSSEFWYLLKNAKLIILPYKDASQSGILASCNSLGKFTLATDVGGLREQNTNGFLARKELDLSTNIRETLKATQKSSESLNHITDSQDNWGLIHFIESF